MMTNSMISPEMTVILVMVLVTLTTRWGGVFVMSFVPINNRVQHFISAMSGSVLVALLAPIFVHGDIGVQMALVTTAAIMLILKQPLIAISAGMVAVSLLRRFYLPL